MTRLLWLPHVLRDAGLTVHEYVHYDETWTSRGRDAMLPRGVVWHHTATSRKWSDWHVAQLLYKGRRDLSGPLAHCGLDRDGAWWVIASGVANHAGSGSWQSLSGNASVVGLEVFNAGDGEPWTDVQYESAVVGTAAILGRIGQSASWLCGHKEWAPGRKIDPYGVDMAEARTAVNNVMFQEDDMPLSDEDVARVAAAVHNQTINRTGVSIGTALDRSWKTSTEALLLLREHHDLEQIRQVVAEEVGKAGRQDAEQVAEATVRRLVERLAG